MREEPVGADEPLPARLHGARKCDVLTREERADGGEVVEGVAAGAALEELDRRVRSGPFDAVSDPRRGVLGESGELRFEVGCQLGEPRHATSQSGIRDGVELTRHRLFGVYDGLFLVARGRVDEGIDRLRRDGAERSGATDISRFVEVPPNGWEPNARAARVVAVVANEGGPVGIPEGVGASPPVGLEQANGGLGPGETGQRERRRRLHARGSSVGCFHLEGRARRSEWVLGVPVAHAQPHASLLRAERRARDPLGQRACPRRLRVQPRSVHREGFDPSRPGDATLLLGPRVELFEAPAVLPLRSPVGAILSGKRSAASGHVSIVPPHRFASKRHGPVVE